MGPSLRASVVVRTKDEADRLRLTLASLGRQDEPAEVVVVDDGSGDHTRAVIEEAAASLTLTWVRHETPAGRSGAANAGAARAGGDVLIFLDGDTLASPDFVRRHLDAHRARSGQVVRGECLHLRQTRFFLDPETGTPRPGEADRVARMGHREIARSLVTRAEVVADFAGIEGRAQPGIYPGHGPRRISEIEMEALRAGRPAQVLWICASGSNQSVGRSAFLASGGYRPDLSINEHRELALRLCQAGHVMAACSARSVHLTHRTGWRDPLADRSWEETFFAAHPIAEVALLSLLWDSLNEASALPHHARITSLTDLARAADRCRGVTGPAQIRARHLANAAPAASPEGASR